MLAIILLRAIYNSKVYTEQEQKLFIETYKPLLEVFLKYQNK